MHHACLVVKRWLLFSEGEELDHRCPHCASDLKWRLLRHRRISRRHSLLPWSGMACPECRKPIARNTHALERQSQKIDGIAMWVLIFVFALVPEASRTFEWPITVPAWIGLVAILYFGYLWHWFRKNNWSRETKTWPRYRIPYAYQYFCESGSNQKATAPTDSASQ
jgi:endogenous inhibitor of DNA gyrase (YacG/DUF329 family)